MVVYLIRFCKPATVPRCHEISAIELLRAVRRRMSKSACSLHMVSRVQVADARYYAAREAFHLLHHHGMRQPKIEHAGQMGESKPLPPISDFVDAELRHAHSRIGLEVVLEAESLSGRKQPLRTGRRLLVNCAARSGGLAKPPAGFPERGFNSREGFLCHVSEREYRVQLRLTVLRSGRAIG